MTIILSVKLRLQAKASCLTNIYMKQNEGFEISIHSTLCVPNCFYIYSKAIYT